MSNRLNQLREKMAERKLGAVIIGDPHNVRYLSGFSESEAFDAILLISATDAQIVTDSRYWIAAAQEAHGFALTQTRRGTYDATDALREFAQQHSYKTLGFEANHVPVARFKAWQKAARKGGAQLKVTEGLVEELRAVKDEAELAIIRRAVELTDRAFAQFCEQARPGMTEKQGAWVIESYIREHGGEGLAFESIVASGPNAALPHAVPTDRLFQTGEPITIDIGARVDGYNADLTRTICLGEPSDKFREIYGIVRRANEAVAKKAKAGMRGKQVDALARKVIEKAGYADYFGHGLGHGVGLAVHEKPGASTKSKDVLQPNMTLTIEPGIYLPEWGGVRIEDLALIQSDGVEVLSQSTKEPVVRI
ncbi:MAG: Xaa-Pro peptidase family protein [Anaerolineae bacterium]